ncbi:MAG TPA: hypothetical protein VIK74_03860 [Parasegetibacter sp.]|jgi:hypothetical protein
MDTKRPLVPGFLKKFDERLLLNQPEIWSTRVHLVLWYGFLFIAALASICFLAPADLRENSGVVYWIGFVIIATIISLVVWLIYLLRFNVFKRYGIIKPLGWLRTFLLYFICIGTIVLFPFVPPYVESVKANLKYGNEELVKDANRMNTLIIQLEYDSLDHSWDTDTFRLVKNYVDVPAYYRHSYYEEDDTDTTSSDLTDKVFERRKYNLIDSAEFESRKVYADSIRQIADSVYVFLDCPRYDMVHAYTPERHSVTKRLDAKQLYDSLVKNFQAPENKQQLLEELTTLIHKYTIYRTNFDDYKIAHLGRFDKVSQKYDLSLVNSAIYNIAEKKYRWDKKEMEWIARVFLYTTLALTLLVFIFRHSTTRTFFLSLLTALILVIFSAVLIAFTGRESQATLQFCLFYFVLFTVLSALVFTSRKRGQITGIAINLFVLMLPFIPMLATTLYHLTIPTYDAEMNKVVSQETIEMRFRIAEICGWVLLLVLIPTYIQAVYRKWFGLPEQ